MSLPPLSPLSDATSSPSPSPSSSSPSSKSKVPLWLPISAFIGTSLALAIPLFMLRKQRGSTLLRTSLKNSEAPPPRRTGASAGSGARTPLTKPPSTSTPTTEAKPDFSSASTGELLAAISRVDFSTAIYAGKAFAIATGLVSVFGIVLTFGVKATMGVQDAQEFGQRMRSMLSHTVPSLSSRINRPPETDEERREVYDVVIPGTNVHENWTWEAAEERMKKAYEEGGFALWMKTALREMEAERRVEQAKREREERGS
ncbi:hypothetical protein BDQ17DRAFT_1249047 [Cyathus striatus]|nr:hypothetical protein BDQ17DRAFT_1249047 [Cyathus striatus]